MRKVFLHFAITADGMVSNVEQWVSFTDEAMKDTSAYHDTVDTIIFGNNNYAPLAGYWQDAETSSNSAGERAFAKKVNEMQKLVLSHGEVKLVWKNSQLLRAKDSATFKQAIARLKNMPGKNITVDSGESTWRSFLENDLWDGLDMLVHPLVVGNGKPLLASMPIKAPLRLVDSRTYDNGVVNLRYERIGETIAKSPSPHIDTLLLILEFFAVSGPTFEDSNLRPSVLRLDYRRATILHSLEEPPLTQRKIEREPRTR